MSSLNQDSEAGIIVDSRNPCRAVSSRSETSLLSWFVIVRSLSIHNVLITVERQQRFGGSGTFDHLAPI